MTLGNAGIVPFVMISFEISVYPLLARTSGLLIKVLLAYNNAAVAVFVGKLILHFPFRLVNRSFEKAFYKMANTITISSSVQDFPFEIVSAKCCIVKTELAHVSFQFETANKEVTLEGQAIETRVLVYLYRDANASESLMDILGNFAFLPGESVLSFIDHEELCHVSVTAHQLNNGNLQVVIRAQTPDLFLEGDIPLMIIIESEVPISYL